MKSGGWDGSARCEAVPRRLVSGGLGFGDAVAFGLSATDTGDRNATRADIRADADLLHADDAAVTHPVMLVARTATTLGRAVARGVAVA